MNSSEPMYSVKEVAFALGVSRDTVIRQINKGKLAALIMPSLSSKRRRVYRTRRVSVRELQRFMDQNLSQ
jgi:excisionase family DNA binding protein